MPWLDDFPDRDLVLGAADATFGMCVRLRREQRGLTQRDLSRRVASLTGLEIDNSNIARLERGERTVTLRQAMCLAYTLNLDSLEEMFDLQRLREVDPADRLRDRLAEAHTLEAGLLSAARQQELIRGELDEVYREIEDLQGRGRAPDA